MVVSLNYCSQNGENVYRDPYYNGNPNIGPRIIGNLDQYPHRDLDWHGVGLRVRVRIQKDIQELVALKPTWGIVKIMVPFWVPIIIRGLIRGLV